MRKPKFGLVILVLTVLTAFGIVAKEFKPLIPLGKPNGLVFESGEFMKQAAYQKVHWYPMGEKAFREARRQGKPIMLLIGTPWSRFGRDYDERIFSDVDVAALMERSFISVRIDGSVDPYWMNAMAPISRPAIGALPEFQIWFLTPNAKPFDVMLFRSPRGPYDSTTLISRLLGALKLLKSESSGNEAMTEQGAIHQNDLDLLASRESKGVPDFEAHLALLNQAAAPEYGGFRTVMPPSSDQGFQRLLPNSLRFYLLRKEYSQFRKSVDSALKGASFDWINGGFFLRNYSPDWTEPQFDKLAVHNAEMMQVMALAGQEMNEPIYEYVAKRTFDSLATEFMDRGLIRACRVGDEVRTSRSPHSSFPPRVLRQLDTKEGVDVYGWAREHLGLRVETNRLMVCMMSDPTLIRTQSGNLKIVLDELRKSSADRPATFAGESLAEVNLVCAAKMIYVARLWGDDARMQIATRLFDECSDFLVGSDVAHGLSLVGKQNAYLGDYLAYADAALQDFLANGRVVSLQQGLRVLKKARNLFKTPDPGVWAMSTEQPLIPNCQNLPEISDTTHESCSARIIRLGNAYGRLLRDLSNNPNQNLTNTASQLAQDAYATMEKFTDIAEAVGPTASGYYSASLGLLDNIHAFAVGPNSAQRAAKLFRLIPNRFVAPCLGDARPDLRNRPAGYYLVESGSVYGPLSLDEAAARLSR